jgi:hypothetical protein
VHPFRLVLLQESKELALSFGVSSAATGSCARPTTEPRSGKLNAILEALCDVVTACWLFLSA